MTNSEFDEERTLSEPKTIKRYQNRKLYDTEASRYVTLEEIAQMLKDGEDVKVIDNRTKEDLTSLTLTQIIFEEEKKKKNFLPLDGLKKLIRHGGSSLGDMYDKLIAPGVNALHSAREDFERSVGKMVKKGKISDDEAKGMIADIKKNTQNVQTRIDAGWQQFTDMIRGITLLSRDVARLEEEVERLSEEVEKLKKEGKA